MLRYAKYFKTDIYDFLRDDACDILFGYSICPKNRKWEYVQHLNNSVLRRVRND